MTVRKSLGIAAATRIAVFVMSFATVVIVSRLLTPAEIGIFSVAVAVVGIGHVFRDFGVGQYLIQLKEVTRQRKRAAFTVTLSFSWTIALLLFLAHPYAARFYGNEGVGHVLLLLVVNFLTLPFGAPLRTLLQRDMQFGKLAWVNLSNHVTSSTVTIATAWAGASYMSMAWGSIAGNVANVVVLLLISPRGALDWPTHHGLREVLGFGAKASTAALAQSAGDAAPDLILGRTLGFADVAFYSRAKGLTGMALDQLMYVVRSVYTPAFAKGFREGLDPADLYGRTAALLLGVTVPLIALLGLLAPALILWLFGAQWGRSGPLGSTLCAFALLTAPFALATTSLTATGHVTAMMKSRLLIEAARIAAMLVSLWSNLEVVIAALGLVYLVEAAVLLRALRSSIGLTTRGLWRHVWRSYTLIPFALAMPGLLVAADGRVFALPTLALLCSASLLGFAGWLLGLHALRHPLAAETRHIFGLVANRLRARLHRDKP